MLLKTWRMRALVVLAILAPTLASFAFGSTIAASTEPAAPILREQAIDSGLGKRPIPQEKRELAEKASGIHPKVITGTTASFSWAPTSGLPPARSLH